MLRIRRLIVLAPLLVGCVPPEDPGEEEPPADGPDFEFRYQTKYVDIATGFSQQVCQGSLDEIDRQIEVVSELLEIPIPADERTRLYWYNEFALGPTADESEVRDWCATSTACYDDGRIFTNSRGLHHELVHAVVTPAWGFTDTLFSEGIAGALDRVVGGSGGVLTIYSVLTQERPSDIVGTNQHSTGHFSRWLVDRSGPAKFRELFERLTRRPTKEEALEAIEAVYGLSLAALEDEYFATAPTIYPQLGLCDDLLAMEHTGDRWELNEPADCDAPYMFGPNERGESFIVATIDIPPELVGESVASWNPMDGRGDIWPCIEEPLYDADPELVGGRIVSNNGPTTFRVAGRHRVELSVPEGTEDIYLQFCPDNGLFPGAYPIDKTIDPKNCVGD